MDALQRGGLAGDQADPLGTVSLGLVGRIPGLPDGGVTVDIAVQRAEDQIAAGEKVLQMPCQSGMFLGRVRVPGAEKGGDRPGSGEIPLSQQPFVQGFAGLKTRPGPLGLALVVDP